MVGDGQINLLRQRKAFLHPGQRIADGKGPAAVADQLAVFDLHVFKLFIVQHQSREHQKRGIEGFLLAVKRPLGGGVVDVINPDLHSAALSGQLLRGDLSPVELVGELQLHRGLLRDVLLPGLLGSVRLPAAFAEDHALHRAGGVGEHIHRLAVRGGRLHRAFVRRGLCALRCFCGRVCILRGGQADAAQYHGQRQNQRNESFIDGFHTNVSSFFVVFFVSR